MSNIAHVTPSVGYRMTASDDTELKTIDTVIEDGRLIVLFPMNKVLFERLQKVLDDLIDNCDNPDCEAWMSVLGDVILEAEAFVFPKESNNEQ